MTQIFAFLDTNTFLHYLPLDQIDWRQVFGTGDVIILVITPVLIRELNKHKDAPKTPRARERASAALRMLDTWADQSAPIIGSETVQLHFLLHEPLIDFRAESLSPDISDDHLIASMIEHKREHPNDVFEVVTADLGLKLKARNHGFSVVQLPIEHRLADEPLASEKRIKQLEEQVRKLEHRNPILKLLFTTEQSHLRVKLRSPSTLSVEALEQKMAEIRSKHSAIELPQYGKGSGSTGSASGILNAHASIFGVKPEDVQQYNSKLDKFYAEYRNYLDKLQAHYMLSGRTASIEMMLINEGTSPAEDVDIFMHFPDGFALAKKGELQEEPDIPEAPRKPLSLLESLSRPLNLSQLYNTGLANYPNFEPTAPRNVSRPSIRRTKSYDVEVNIRKAKHGQIETLDPLFAIFESAEDARSFAIDYEIHATNLPVPSTGQLHVVVGNQ